MEMETMVPLPTYTRSRGMIHRSSTVPDFCVSTPPEGVFMPPVLEHVKTELSLVKRKKNRKTHTRARKKVFELLSEVQDDSDRSAKIEKLRSSISAIEAQFKRLGKPTISSMPTNKPSEHHESSDKPVVLTSIRFEMEYEALRYFKSKVRVVVITLRWINYILRINETKRALNNELKSFTDIAFEFEESEGDSHLRDSGLTFDKSYFKSNKEITLSLDIRRTLTTRYDCRTNESIKQVMHGLQTLKSLAEYPLHIQEKLCRVAWYQVMEPKKAIIRQGHIAESFYFILSGKAFVKKMAEHENGETELRTLARLGRGQSFGEIALLYQTVRTATVESATYMELLVIGRDDFIRIFTNGESPDDEPDHVKFLRNVPVLRDWPLSVLAKEPGSCILHYFKRGAVVTMNNEDSEWIYIVKAGYCDVLKRLQAVKARSAIELSRRPKAVDNVTPQTCAPITSARIDNGSKRRRCCSVTPDVYDAMSDYFLHTEVKRHPDLGRRRLRHTESMPLPVRTAIEPSDEAPKPPDPKSRMLQRRQSLRVIVANYTDMPEEPSDCRKSPFLPLLRLQNKTPTAQPAVESKPVQRRRGGGGGFPGSALPNIQEKPEVTFRPKKLEKEEHTSRDGVKESMFVSVETLRPKDVFGINTLQLGESALSSSPVCLVSRGAELILLSKKLFLRNATDDLKRKIQSTTMGYPVEGAMQKNLQQELDWKLFKTTVVGNYVTANGQKRTLPVT